MRRGILVAALAAALAAAVPTDATAQQATRPLVALRVGDTLRVWARSPAEQVGTLAAPVGDTLSIVRPDGRRQSFAVASLTHVDVQRGSSRSSGAGVAGALLGIGAGFLVGGIMGAWIDCSNGCDGRRAGGGFAIGALSGSVLGGIGGHHLLTRRPAATWVQIFP